MKLKSCIGGLFLLIFLALYYFSFYQSNQLSRCSVDSELSLTSPYNVNDQEVGCADDTRQYDRAQVLIQSLSNVVQSPVAMSVVNPPAQEKHTFKELENKEFRTRLERQKLFAALDIEYLNEIAVAYEPVLDVDPRSLEKYQAHKEACDILTEIYGDDIAHHHLACMSVRWLGKDVGYGVFAEEDLAEGDFIGIYTGVVQDRSLVTNRDYSWSYPGLTTEGAPLTLDAHFYGNELRFINDGAHPNCIVRYIIGKDDFWHVCYIASQSIQKGEQFLVSYGPAYWDTRKYSYQEFAQVQ